MAKYAVIKTGGKQYKVAEGETVVVEKLSLAPNSSYSFEEVLLVVDGASRKVGTPIVSGAVVKGTVVGDKKDKKVRVAKFKAKAKYRRVTGHRSTKTHVKIESISLK